MRTWFSLSHRLSGYYGGANTILSLDAEPSTLEDNDYGCDGYESLSEFGEQEVEMMLAKGEGNEFTLGWT